MSYLDEHSPCPGCGAKLSHYCQPCFAKQKLDAALVPQVQKVVDPLIDALSLTNMLERFNAVVNDPIRKAVWQERIGEKLKMQRRKS